MQGSLNVHQFPQKHIASPVRGGGRQEADEGVNQKCCNKSLTLGLMALELPFLCFPSEKASALPRWSLILLRRTHRFPVMPRVVEQVLLRKPRKRAELFIDECAHLLVVFAAVAIYTA